MIIEYNGMVCQNPHPWVDILRQIPDPRAKMSCQNPQVPPPPPLGQNIDTCIKLSLTFMSGKI